MWHIWNKFIQNIHLTFQLKFYTSAIKKIGQILSQSNKSIWQISIHRNQNYISLFKARNCVRNTSFK